MTKLQKEDTETKLKGVSISLCALFLDCGRWEGEGKKDVDVIEEAVSTMDRSFKKKIAGASTGWFTAHGEDERQQILSCRR